MKQFFLLVAVAFCSLPMFAQSNAIKVQVKGEGIPVLFLPGFACSGAVWNSTINQLSPGMQAHVVTYAGFDGVAPIEMPWYPALKAALIAYVQQLKAQQVYVVGHSMGGNLATELAASLPEKVTKIVLVDAIPCMREVMMPGVPAESIVYDAPYNQQMIKMDSTAMQQYARMMAGNMTNNKEAAETITQWAMQADRTTYVYGYVDLLKLDLRNELPKIKADVLILGAPFPNKEIVAANYAKQYAQLAQKQMEFASNSKHFIMYDAPEWLIAQTNAFLTK